MPEVIEVKSILLFVRSAVIGEYDLSPSGRKQPQVLAMVSVSEFFFTTWPFLKYCRIFSNQGYSTVSHFNIVHYDCHMAAVR